MLENMGFFLLVAKFVFVRRICLNRFSNQQRELSNAVVKSFWRVMAGLGERFVKVGSSAELIEYDFRYRRLLCLRPGVMLQNPFGK